MEEKKYDLIKFNDGEFSLDVNVSPNDASIWLTQKQIAELFDKSISTINEHIKKILKNELNEYDVTRKFGKTELSSVVSKPKTFYNLDVILCVGYKVNSKRGIQFRKWANQVLKQYLLKGYSIDENRLMAYQSNILQLESNYLSIEKRLRKVEDIINYHDEKLLYEGEILDAYTFIRKLFFLAKKEITIIDLYADKFLLSMLIDVKVKITIITSSNSYLNNTELQDNITIIKNDVIHDRFIIIDEVVYIIGTSFNEIGKKRFVIIKSNYLTKDKILK